MSRVGFVVHSGRDEALRVADQLSDSLASDGIDIWRLPDDGEVAETNGAGCDLIVSVGGDGTLLRGAREAARLGCPVLGVKVGRMGFLTEAEPGQARAVIDDVLAGTAQIEQRTALEASVDGADMAPQWALNEIIVEKTARHRLVRLAVSVDGVGVTTFSADGVIVATATGTTAYSFSARGPIVTPTLALMVVTPVAAHMVFDRSFVLAPQEGVVLEVVGDEPGILSADGRESMEVPVGARVRISAAAEPLLFVRGGDGASFYARVRDKFGLPGAP